jgi:predicted acyltransferase
MNKQERLYSLDALRGFDMFFIVGGAAFIKAVFGLFPSSFSDFMIRQMAHVDWHGFTFYDMIFPLFLFVAGVSFPYSLANSRGKGYTNSKIAITIVKRGMKLIIFGFVFNGILTLDFENMRYASVLGRIGVAWMIAALIYVFGDIKWSIGISFVILIGYYLLSLFLINPTARAGISPFSLEGSFAAWLDANYFIGKTLKPTYEPEGYLSTLPAIVTAMLGIITGNFLKSKRYIAQKKVLLMFVASVALIIIGLWWNYFFPINKNLWTSSYVCFVGGLSLLLLTVFYYIIDVLKFRKWSFVFVVIGMNSITIYMAQKIVNFKHIAKFLGGGTVELFPVIYQPLISSIIYLVIIWCFLYFLYRKNIFLKV